MLKVDAPRTTENWGLKADLAAAESPYDVRFLTD